MYHINAFLSMYIDIYVKSVVFRPRNSYRISISSLKVVISDSDVSEIALRNVGRLYEGFNNICLWMCLFMLLGRECDFDKICLLNGINAERLELWGHLSFLSCLLLDELWLGASSLLFLPVATANANAVLRTITDVTPVDVGI